MNHLQRLSGRLDDLTISQLVAERANCTRQIERINAEFEKRKVSYEQRKALEALNERAERINSERTAILMGV